MVGLDAAGKTTILYKLKLGEGERRKSGDIHWLRPLAAVPFSFTMAAFSNIFAPEPLLALVAIDSGDDHSHNWV